jgi:hypothetical protein
VHEFDPRAYGPACAELLSELPCCPLAAGQPQRDRQSQLADLDAADLAAGRTIVDLDMANCCLAGLWLAYNFLDESHTISQQIHTGHGSYWHGIMHRREPDFSNAKYWFRRVGQHPIFPELAAAASELTKDVAPGQPLASLQGIVDWDPFQFVDLCQAALRAGGVSQRTCEQIAQAEWQLLFDHCYGHAFQ